MMSVRYCFLAKEAKRKQTILLRGLWAGKSPSPIASERFGAVSHVVFRLRVRDWSFEVRDTEEGQGQGLQEVSSCHV